MNVSHVNRLTSEKMPDNIADLAKSLENVSMTDADGGESTPYASDEDLLEDEAEAIPNSADSFPRWWRKEDDEYRTVAIQADKNLGEYLRMTNNVPDVPDPQAEQHQSALEVFGNKPMVIHDAWRGDLTQTVFLHLKYRVVHDHIPLLTAAEELHTKYGIDVKWLALIQIGRDLIDSSAEHHGLDLLYDGPSRTKEEFFARVNVHQVKSTVWDALCSRYESAETMQRVGLEKDEHEARFGRDAWIGDRKLEEFFQPFVEGEDVQNAMHARPFYRDIFVPQFELSKMMGGMELD